MSAPLPHPIPYQGSKRKLADRILAVTGQQRFTAVYEPFAGSAAYTLAAASRGLAARYVIGDSLRPLVRIWDRILDEPEHFATDYETLWSQQLTEGGPQHYARIRREFNLDGDPTKLLYLLARCVKNAPRFGPGGFNQSPDHRRKGMNPKKMRRAIQEASLLMSGRTSTFAGEAEVCLAEATPGDLIYMDPPWQGTTEGVDKRYHQGFDRARLEALLSDLNKRAIPWILSYDGRSGTRTYGEPLPQDLWGAHLELAAGRSSQSTLAGRAEHTIESLYVSDQLVASAAARAAERSATVEPATSLFAVDQAA
jgi:DNA adenine methylase